MTAILALIAGLNFALAAVDIAERNYWWASLGITCGTASALAAIL